MSPFSTQTERDSEQLTQEFKSVLVLTLSQEPMVRFSSDESPFVLFVGNQKGVEKPSVAVLRLPKDMAQGQKREELDTELRALGGGDTMSLAGQWRKHRWMSPDNTPQQSWSFESRVFAKGEHSLDQLLARETPRQEQAQQMQRAMRDQSQFSR